VGAAADHPGCEQLCQWRDQCQPQRARPGRLLVAIELDLGRHDGEISASHKGRGLGDCWSRSSWIWDGTRFVLAYEGTTGLCRSVPGGTWELPTHVTTVREP